MVNDHQRFSNITSGIQSLVVVAAVVIGGLWTAVTFGLVELPEQRRLETEQRRLQAEQQRLADSGLSISIDAGQEPWVGDKEYAIVAKVRITNRAATPRPVDFDNAPLTVQKVMFAEGLSSVIDQPVRSQRNVHALSRVIRSGETVEYPYVVTVSERGVYRVALLLKLSKEEYAVHLASGGPATVPEGEIYWDAQGYVFVR